jgi:hypothetical protein
MIRSDGAGWCGKKKGVYGYDGVSGIDFAK